MSATHTEEQTWPNASEAGVAEPETALESRGASEVASGTDAGGDAQAAPALVGLRSTEVAPFVPLKLGFPNLWPGTAVEPIFFKLDYLLSEDADREQSAFLKLTEDERAAESYHYDCRMLSLLSCEPPEGFADFPRMRDDFDPDNAEHRLELQRAVFGYLYRPDTREARAFAFVARHFMSRYWARVMPREYL